MDILFLTENFPPETNAAATRVYERACYWVEAGHAVTVVTCAPNFPEGRLFPGYRNRWRQVESMEGMRVVRVKTFIAANAGVVRRTLDFLSFMTTGFLAGLVERRADVVVATSPQFFTAVAGWGVAASRRRPFVFELGDLWPASIAAVGALPDGGVLRALERLELFLYRRAAAVVTLTESFKANLVARGIPPGKIVPVRNGVDLRRYAPRPRDEALAASWGLAPAFTVGYVGTHGLAHGLRHVLDAAELLREEPTVRFLLVGAGAERDALVRDARHRGLTNVVLAPPQPKQRMPSVWSLCDVALIHLRDDPVFADVLPSKMFEAMAMGLPLLLAVPVGEATRLAEAEGAGCAVAPGDPRALRDAVLRLRDDRPLRDRLAAAALAAAPRHSRASQAERMLEVLRAVVDGDGVDPASRVPSLSPPRMSA